MKKTICICGAALNETFEAETIEAILKKANDYGYGVQIFSAVDELWIRTANNIGDSKVFDLINYDACCGIIMFCERIKDMSVCNRIIRNAKEHQVPVVSIDMKLEGCHNITFDYSDTFEKIVRHVIEFHGCKDVYVMGGLRNNEFSDARINVVRKVLAENGLTLAYDHLGYGDFWAQPCIREIGKFLDSGLPLPDAFIAVNDIMAITIIEELKLRGYRIPEDTIVTGFDGIASEKYCIPRLTTAAQNNQESGNTAVEIIHSIVNNKPVQENYMIPFEIRFSESCGCKPVEHDTYVEYIRFLLNKIDWDHQYSRYMDDMCEKLTLVRDIDNVYKYINEFTVHLGKFRNHFICLDKDYLSSDAEFFNRIDNSNSEQDMVVLYGHTEKNGDIKSLESFKKSELVPSFGRPEVRNELFIVLHIQDEVYGHCVFEVNEGLAEFYKISQFVSSFSQVLSTNKQSCEMKRAFKELSAVKAEIEQLYIIDPLTGSFNRRGFYQKFTKLLKEKNTGYVVVISADVDYLKHINDNFGHKEGDYAIIALSDALRNAVGDNGFVARFGGDEYVAALFMDRFSDLQRIDIDHLICKFAQKLNETNNKPYKLKFSYGYEVVELPMFRDVDQIIESSDVKMYEMKKKHYQEDGE